MIGKANSIVKGLVILITRNTEEIEVLKKRVEKLEKLLDTQG